MYSSTAKGAAFADLSTHAAADFTQSSGYYTIHSPTRAATATALNRILEGATTTLWLKQVRCMNKKQ